MGEKRAYKARKSGGGRKKLKPEYDAGKNMKEQMDAAVALYNSEVSLQAIGEELGLNPIKVRKLLITAGVYESEVAEKVQDTFEEYRETQDYITSILTEYVHRAEKKQQDMTEHEKCLTNGTYERARESGTEQNYDMIDGCVNNVPKKPRRIGGRWSVLDRLHIKQAERKQKEQTQQQQQQERSRKN